jgi:acetate kinase
VRVLVLNAGSSSLKGSVVDGDRTLATAQVSWGDDATRAADRVAGLRSILQEAVEQGVGQDSIEAVGHRIVHGGSAFYEPVVVDDEVVATLAGLSELAPLHNAVALETLRGARAALSVPHVACFDTSFHATLPEAVARYPVPDEWSARFGIRRFGFHGLSVEWAVGRAAALLERPVEELGLVVAHLGSGCSVTAVAGGRSDWTSMGFTPLEGLMMGTRAGSIDPGILVHVLRRGGLNVDDLSDALEHRSGLLAVAGTADVRELEARADGGDDRAILALEMFAARAAAGIATAAVHLGRVDALVFTGGIGEHAGPLRAAIVERLTPLGFGPIPAEDSGADGRLEGAAGGPAVLRIEAREDLVIARATERLVD